MPFKRIKCIHGTVFSLKRVFSCIVLNHTVIKMNVSEWISLQLLHNVFIYTEALNAGWRDERKMFPR